MKQITDINKVRIGDKIVSYTTIVLGARVKKSAEGCYITAITYEEEDTSYIRLHHNNTISMGHIHEGNFKSFNIVRPPRKNNVYILNNHAFIDDENLHNFLYVGFGCSALSECEDLREMKTRLLEDIAVLLDVISYIDDEEEK